MSRFFTTTGFNKTQGTGLSNGGVSFNSMGIKPYVVDVTVNNGPIESDEKRSFVGPGASSDVGSGTANDTKQYGFSTATGTSVQIDNENGNETVKLTHFTGAAIMIDSDGSIHIMPTGQKGFGINASSGKGVIYAHGDLAIKSESSVFIEAGGNLEMNVKDDLMINVEGNFITTVRGNRENHISGNSIDSVAQDKSETVGGQERITLAGDTRTQVAGAVRYDVGKSWDQRVTERMSMTSQKSAAIIAKQNVDVGSNEGGLIMYSKESMMVQTNEDMHIYAKQNITLDGEESIYSRANDKVLISSKNNVNVDSDSNIVIRSANIRMDTDDVFDLRSGNILELNSTSFLNIGSDNINMNAPSGIDLRGLPVNLNLGGPADPLAPGEKQTTDPRGSFEENENPPPEFISANTVIDSQTSRREQPDIPINTRGRSARTLSTYEHEGGPQLTGRAKQEYSDNPGVSDDINTRQGARMTVAAGGAAPPENTSKATQNPLPIPSLSNPNAMLSKHITVGQFFPRSRIHAANRGHVIAAMNVCWNIADPLIEEARRRGVNLMFTSGFRLGGRGSKHTLGEAMDFQPAGGSHTVSFDLAEWVWKNLPYRAILFELSNNKLGLLHLESNQPGQGAGGKVFTCSNNRCNAGNRVEGLNWNWYATRAKGRGARVR